MKQAMLEMLASFAGQADELSERLMAVDARAEPKLFAQLTREYSRAIELDRLQQGWQEQMRARAGAESHLKDSSEEIRALSEDELGEIDKRLAGLEREIHQMLMPKDSNDGRNLYLEIRAGTGGEEAALFAADLLRMYQRYAEAQRWATEIVSASAAEQGGYREVVCRVEGKKAWSRLRFESGVHRVQRIPVTESQGRIHTSAASVAVLPEPDSIDEVDISPDDLRIDTFRASGAGGQHVNKTDSAVRITHLPTRTVIECQSERSQHKNRASAMSLLRARLLRDRRLQAEASQSAQRRSMVGSGDRSEKIRTYNFPQSRVTDHRIGHSFHNLPEILDGSLDNLVDEATRFFQEEQIEQALATAAGPA